MAKKKTSKKLCPNLDYFFEPVLKALDMLGGSGSNEEIYKKVLAITNLPDNVVEEMHTFTMSEVEYRLMWARTYLKNFGAVENSKQGVWALTWLSSASVIKAKLEHHKSAISVAHWEPTSRKAYLSLQAHSPVKQKKRHRAKVNV